jgi:clan AA aspartic protease
MGVTHVDIAMRNPREPSRRSTVRGVMVDTGSELTWVPATVLEQIGIAREKQRRFVLADRREIKRFVGFAILELGRHRTVDEVVFGEASDLSLLGARSLEGFGLSIDPQSHRLRSTPTIAAQNVAPKRPWRRRRQDS